MNDDLSSLRFDSEHKIVEALLFLIQRGVETEALEETLIACGPVDLDLLATVMRQMVDRGGLPDASAA